MLETIIVVLVILWLIGMVSSYTMGGLIHVLLVISACTGGAIMFIYSSLLIVLNRRALPAAIAPGPFRIAALAWATLFFGVLSALTLWQQLQRFM